MPTAFCVYLWWMDSGGRFSRGGENGSRPESQSSRTHCRAISAHRAFGRRTQRRRFPLRTDCRFSRCLSIGARASFANVAIQYLQRQSRLRSARITCALHGGIDIIQPQVHPSCRPAGSKHRSEHRLDQDQSRSHPPAPLRCSTLAQSVRAPPLFVPGHLHRLSTNLHIVRIAAPGATSVKRTRNPTAYPSRVRESIFAASSMSPSHSAQRANRPHTSSPEKPKRSMPQHRHLAPDLSISIHPARCRNSCRLQ